MLPSHRGERLTLIVKWTASISSRWRSAWQAWDRAGIQEKRAERLHGKHTWLSKYYLPLKLCARCWVLLIVIHQVINMDKNIRKISLHSTLKNYFHFILYNRASTQLDFLEKILRAKLNLLLTILKGSLQITQSPAILLFLETLTGHWRNYPKDSHYNPDTRVCVSVARRTTHPW